jgi:hypothetical protein
VIDREHDVQPLAASRSPARTRHALCITGNLSGCSARQIRNGLLLANLIAWGLIAYSVSLLT